MVVVLPTKTSLYLRNSLHPENLHSLILPLSHQSDLTTLCTNRSPPLGRRGRRKYETLAATSTSWDRPRMLLELWEHRRSGYRNHCSPILTTFPCIADDHKERRITRSFKGFQLSLLVIGELRGNDAPPLPSDEISAFLWCGFLGCLLIVP